MRILSVKQHHQDSLSVVHKLAYITRNDGHRCFAWLTECEGQTAIQKTLNTGGQFEFNGELHAYLANHGLTLLH